MDYGRASSPLESWRVPTPLELWRKGTPSAGPTTLESYASVKNSALLRGIPLDAAMQRFGALFSTASGVSSPTSDIPSKKSTRLQDFISHNWVTKRTEKFLCLALHYNLTAAICASWGVALLACVLTLMGVLPVDMPANAVPTCVNATISGQVAFFVVFLGAQDFRRLLHRVGLAQEGRLVFVDKACISQMNPELKREGIENLAGFLLASQNIVVVFGPEYLYKLWTVYELATFVMMHQDHTRIKVLPTLWLWNIGAVNLGLHLAQFVFFTLVYIWRRPLTALVGYLVGASFFCAVGGYFNRQWQRQQVEITAAIEDFSIRKTKCAVESDRIQVQDNVRAFLHCLGRIGSETGEDALDEFDTIVREVLPLALASSIGSIGIPYSQLVGCTSIFVASALDNAAARSRAGTPLPGILAILVFHISGCLSLIPLATFLVQKLLARRLQLRGCADGLYIAAALVPGLGLYFAAYLLQYSVGYNSSDGRAWALCAALLTYCGIMALATVAVFAKREANQVNRLSGLIRHDGLPPGTNSATETPAATLTPPVLRMSQWRGRFRSLDWSDVEEVVSGSGFGI